MSAVDDSDRDLHAAGDLNDLYGLSTVYGLDHYLSEVCISQNRRDADFEGEATSGGAGTETSRLQQSPPSLVHTAVLC